MACEATKVPFAALLVVTNVVGRNGRQQWLQNHEAAAVRGAEIVMDWLEKEAPGSKRGT
jgi:nucleoside phosphorylase